MSSVTENANDNQVFSITFHEDALEISYLEQNGSTPVAQLLKTISVIYRTDDELISREIESVVIKMLEMGSYAVDIGLDVLTDSAAAIEALVEDESDD